MRAQTENAKSRLQNGGTVFYSGVIQRRTAEEGREQSKFDFVAAVFLSEHKSKAGQTHLDRTVKKKKNVTASI